MHRDRQQETGFKAGTQARHQERREWESGREQQHQMEAREHARQPGKTHRTHELRAAEAEHQIRELRSRY